MFPSLINLPPADYRRELRRLAAIARPLRKERDKRKLQAEHARRESIAPAIVADYLAFMPWREICRKHGIHRGVIQRAVHAATTRAQRLAVRRHHRAANSRRFDLNNRTFERTGRKHGQYIVEVAGVEYPSLTLAAKAAGISLSCASYRLREGVPLDAPKSKGGRGRERAA